MRYMYIQCLLNCVRGDTGTSVTQFPGYWTLSQTVPIDYPVLSLSWNKEGKQLLVGGEHVTLWAYSVSEFLTVPNQDLVVAGGDEGVWGELWRCGLALPAVRLNFSPDGAMFTTASKDDHFVKIWYRSKAGVCMCE